MRKRWGMITTPFRNFASSVLSKRSGAMLFRQSLQASPAMFPTLTAFVPERASFNPEHKKVSHNR